MGQAGSWKLVASYFPLSTYDTYDVPNPMERGDRTTASGRRRLLRLLFITEQNVCYKLAENFFRRFA